MQKWSDTRRPSSGDSIIRDLGTDEVKVCIVKGYKRLIAVNPSSLKGGIRNGPLGAAQLPDPMAGANMDFPPVITMCGEEVPPRLISMLSFWPAVTTLPVNCEKCLTLIVPKLPAPKVTR